MSTVRVLVGTAAALGALAAACSTPGGRPPIARIELSPEAIAENDGQQTPVVLDATRSADPADDPEGTAPLQYLWTLEGDDFELEPGSRLTDPMVVVRFRGDRPATITLRVTDVDGLDDEATAYLQLTAAP
jgi:hypothetical protein